MSEKASTAGRLLLNREDDSPERAPFPDGEVIAFSISSPNKDHNEDCAAVLPYSEGGVLAVADGMGGHAGGQQASTLAVKTLSKRVFAASEAGEELRHVVLDAVEAANRSILDLGVGAGTTFAAAIIRDGNARAIHAGDSLVLHVGQRGRIRAQTISHSPTGYAVEAGVLTESAAMVHAERHVISNFVGLQDMRLEVGPSVSIAKRDTLLVASDGLADNLTIQEIVDIIRKGPLLAAAEKLVALARKRMASPDELSPNKPDDLTVLLFRPAMQ